MDRDTSAPPSPVACLPPLSLSLSLCPVPPWPDAFQASGWRRPDPKIGSGHFAARPPRGLSPVSRPFHFHFHSHSHFVRSPRGPMPSRRRVGAALTRRSGRATSPTGLPGVCPPSPAPFTFPFTLTLTLSGLPVFRPPQTGPRRGRTRLYPSCDRGRAKGHAGHCEYATPRARVATAGATGCRRGTGKRQSGASARRTTLR